MSSPLLRGRVLAALFLVLSVAFVVTMFRLSAWVAPSVAQWVRAHGALGLLAWVALYACSLVVMTPIALPAALSGYIFGALPGIAIALPTSTLGCVLSFLFARTALRNAVLRRVENMPRFQAVRRAVGRGGLRIVALLRLSPVLPHNMMNYALGVTTVSLRHYALGSFLGMAPLLCLQVYAGSLMKNLDELSRTLSSMTVWHYAGLAVGLAATVVALMSIVRLARKELALASAQPDDMSAAEKTAPGASVVVERAQAGP